MIELRKADNDEALIDVKSAKIANSGKVFSKLQEIFILLVTGHWVKFSERFYIYDIIYLFTIPQKIQCVSLHTLKKRMMAIGHLHITLP
jgi:hypothetical protein